MFELLHLQGWDLRRPPAGELLCQQEYNSHPHLLEPLKGTSKSGSDDALPEALLVDRVTLTPLAVLDAKPIRLIYLTPLGSPLAITLCLSSEKDIHH
jgi:hypothetical protein